MCIIVSLVCSRNAWAFSATISTSDDVQVDIMPRGDDGIGTSISETEMRVTSDCGFGYDLIVSGGQDSNLYLNGDSNNNSENTYLTPADGESRLFESPNTWGISLMDDNDHGVFYPIDSNGFALKTVDGTATTNDDFSIDDFFPLYYGVSVSTQISSGAYRMADNGAVNYQLTLSPLCVEYDVLYNGNGADAGEMISNGEELINAGVIEGREMTFYAPNYSKTGYGFLGWSLDENAASKILDNNPENDPTIYGPNETITLESTETMMADIHEDIDIYAVWIPSEGDLQGWDGCDDLSPTIYDAETGALKMTNELTEGSENYVKSITALTDTRDGETYAVAKLADGKCWTIENLRLNLKNVEITKENTNHPTDSFAARASGLEQTSFAAWSNSVYDGGLAYNADNMNRDLAPSHNLDIDPSSWYSYGTYFKYTVASAGNYDTVPAPGDICPRGWHLPVYYGTGTDMNRNDFAVLLNTIGDVSSAEKSEIMRSAPNNFVLAGHYTYRQVETPSSYVYELSGRGRTGYYATSDFKYSGNTNYIVPFAITTSNASSSLSLNYTAITVRCISGDEATAEITYDANGGTNAPSSLQSAPGRGLYEITVSNDVPTRSGYTFVAWIDRYGNEYHGGDTFTTDSDDTLYAKWENSSCNDSATSISQAVCLQDMNATVKATMAQKATYNLIDARDGKTYTVSLLDDGNVWMTKNLNLGNESQKLITSDDSDLESGVLILPDSALSFSGYTVHIYNTNAYGGYYSFKAAVAGDDSFKGQGTNAKLSICPKGWDLPNRYQYDYLKSRANLNSYSAASASPYNFIYAGYLNGTTTNSQTSSIRLWTSTMNSSGISYYSSGYSYSSYNNNYQNYGESVRCIMKNGEADIVYYGNGDASYPVNAPTTVSKSVEINADIVENVGFERPHWSFETWNTAPNGSGTTYAVGTAVSELGLSDGDERALYAQWSPQLEIVYHSNDGRGLTTSSFAKTGTTYTTGGKNHFPDSNGRILSWNTASDGNGTNYDVETEYTAPSGMVTPSTLDLYAQWEPTYTIVYDGNGSDGDDTALMSSVSHTEVGSGDSIKLYASNFSRVGYGFAGWSFDPNAANNIGSATIYGPNETITAPTYTTDEITLYAVWIAADQTDTLQSFSINKRCASMSTGDILALADERDDNVYMVAKLADDRCWMTENLRLVLGSAGTDENDKTIVGAVSVIDGSVSALNILNTNNPSTDFLHASDFHDEWQQYTRENSYEKINFGTTNLDRSVEASYNGIATYGWGIHQESSWYSYGVMYDWYAATAGRGLVVNRNYSDAVSGDICPSGWHLSLGTSNGEIANLKTNVTSLTEFPNNFTYSGIYYTNGDKTSSSSSTSSSLSVYSAAMYRGEQGYYWLSNPASVGTSGYASGAVYYTRNTGYEGLGSMDRLRAAAVRCLMNEEKDYTLHYNANGGSGAPGDAAVTDMTVGRFTVSDVVPTRTGYTFEGWYDEDGYRYEAGDDYLVPYTLNSGTLYAKWVNSSCNPSATDIDDAVCLQDINGDVKATMDYKETYTLVDARDNEEYTVALLDDNNVWLTKNLSFGASEDRLLTSEDTDLPSGKVVVLPASVTSISGSAFASLIDATYGGYYNYYAATLDLSGGNALTSICPKGWDLPTRAQYNDFHTMAEINTSAEAMASPYNFVASGYITGTERSGGIMLWTSNYITSSMAFTSNVYETISNGYVNTRNSMSYGRAVRCIMNNGTVSVHYDANGGTGTMNDQIDVDSSTAIVSKNGFGDPELHKMFKEWNTEADGTGISIDPDMAVSSIGVSDGETVTLYAQWEDVNVVTFVNTESGATQIKKVAIGDNIQMYLNPGWSRSGYNLAGWDIDPAGVTIVYKYSQTVTPENDITVYTAWKQYYTVNYDINTDDPNAEGAMTQTHTNVYEGNRLSLLGGNFSRTGYGFVGWSFDPDAASDIENATIYGPSESFEAPAYTADVATLYAVWIASSGNLQDFDCSDLDAGGITALTDTRDGDTYAVAKLADGECWMIENLRLDSTADANLMATDSQGTGGNFTTLPASSTSWSTADYALTEAKVNTNNTNRSLTASPYNSGNSWYIFGNYYSWAAAIADDTDYGKHEVADSNSICPAGWHLPNGGSVVDSDFYQLTFAITGLEANYGAGYSGDYQTTVYFALQSFPNNFVRAGYWSGSSASQRQYDMFYWTNKSSNSAYSGTSIVPDAYVLYYHNGAKYFYPGTSTSQKYMGASVRCIAD